FNLLAIALCLPLFDNASYQRLFPPVEPTLQTVSLQWPPWLLIAVSIGVFALSVARLLRLLRLESRLVILLNHFLDSFPIVNHYGLFSVMTTNRMEIVVEGSRDGREWL